MFPVVHVNNVRQAVEQCGIAFGSGADGVYLIDHHGRPREYLVGVFAEVDLHFPGQFIGLNFLSCGSALEAFQVLQQSLQHGVTVRHPDGLWVDDALVNHQRTAQFRKTSPPLTAISYLGGVAFKYTRTHTEDPSRAAEEARRLEPFVDVITTSGPGTGQPASPDKIASMKEAAPAKPIAVASGVDITNCELYTPIVDQVLVASSVETEPGSGVFDRLLLAELIAALHGDRQSS